MNHDWTDFRHSTADLFQSEVLWAILQPVADTHAPSQTVTYTRAAVIADLLRQHASGSYRFTKNYRRTGNGLLQLGASPPRLIFSAHADEFSYLIGAGNKNDGYPLQPFCSDRTTIDYQAVALRYNIASDRLEPVARGLLKRIGADSSPVFFPAEGRVSPGDRIVYHHPLQKEGDTLYGSLDNAGSVAACLLAALALLKLAPDTPVAFAFTDEEEGPPALNASFGRGARRLARQPELPPLVVNVDGHNISDWCQLSKGASFAQASSGARGAVTPPRLYVTFQALAADMAKAGILLQENMGYVSRSDDVAWMEVTPNILLLGFPLDNPHFNQAPPSASLEDLLHLAQTVATTALAFSREQPA